VTRRRQVLAGFALAAVAAIAGCLDALAPGAPRAFARLGIVPVFGGAANHDGIPADVDSIVITIHNPPASDTTIALRILPGQDSIVITIDIPITGAIVDTVTIGMEAIRTGPPVEVLYRADNVPLVVRVGQPTRADSIRADYVGPGAGILRAITLTPRSVVLRPGETLNFAFTAIDSSGAACCATMPIIWNSRTPSVATVTARGVVTGQGNGEAWIVATSGASGAIKDSVQIVVATGPVALISFGPSSATFTANAGQANPAAQSVAVTNGGAGTLANLTVSGIQYAAGQPTGWLATTLAGASAPTTMTLSATTGTLPPGTYSAAVSLVSPDASNSPIALPVTFTVNPVPAIGFTPSTVTVLDTLATTDPASITVSVTNIGTGTLSGLVAGAPTYGASQPTGWLTASLGATTTAPATLTLTFAKGALSAGVYTATVPITSPVAANSPRNLAVTFTVVARPAIGLSAAAVTFTDTIATLDNPSQTVTVSNSGSGTLSGLAVGTINWGTGPTGWLTAVLNQTTAPATLTLSAAKGSLAVGTYTATVPVTSGVAANSPQTVTVTFVVVAGPAIGLSATAATFTDTITTADNPAQTIAVTNSGNATLTGLAVGTINWGTGPTGWLTATLNQTTAPATLTLSAAKGSLAVGTYTATVPVTSGVASNSPRTVTVTLTVVPVPLVRMILTPGYAILPPAGTLPLGVQGFNAAGGSAPTFALRFVSRTPSAVAVDSVTGVVTAGPGGPAVGRSAVIVASATGTTGTVYDSTLVAVAANGVAVALPVGNGRAFGNALVGDTVHVVVAVNIGAVTGEKLGSYNAQLNWNSSVLRYVSTDTAAFAAPVLNETNTGTGELRFGAADVVGNVGPAIALVDVKFVARAAGASPTTFALTDLSAAVTFTQMLTQALVLSGGVQVK